MGDTYKDLAGRLAKISRELADISAMLRGLTQAEIFPEWAAEKVAKRICLHCGRTIPLDERYVRGLCGKDGQALKDRINSGEITNAEAISQGLRAPKTSGGRKPTESSRLREFLTAKDKLSESEVESAARKAQRKARSKRSP